MLYTNSNENFSQADNADTLRVALKAKDLPLWTEVEICAPPSRKSKIYEAPWAEGRWFVAGHVTVPKRYVMLARTQYGVWEVFAYIGRLQKV